MSWKNILKHMTGCQKDPASKHGVWQMQNKTI